MRLVFDPPSGLGPAFDIMVEYYQLTLFVFRVELCFLTSPAPRVSVVNYPIFSIDSPNALTTFDLNRIGHNLKIDKYTVVMGKFSKARIGWRDISQEYKRPTNPAKGVGDYEGTISLLCDSVGGLLVNGRLVKSYHDWHVREGTQIECRLPYKDERFEDPDWKMSDDVLFVTFPWKADEVVPCISITGSLRITDIQYST
jgi:hypothetical protein